VFSIEHHGELYAACAGVARGLANTVAAAINSKRISKRIGFSRTSTKRFSSLSIDPDGAKDQGSLRDPIGGEGIRHQHS
jgi:hypothetical protein